MKQLLVLFCLVVLLVLRLFNHFSTTEKLYEGKSLTISYTFFTEPKKTSTGQGFFVNGVYVLLPRFPEYEYGQSIRVTGKVSHGHTTQKNASTNHSEVLALRNEGTGKPFWILKDPRVTRVDGLWFEGLLSVTRYIRERTVYSFNRTLDAQKSSLLMGMVFGIKEGMNENFEDQLTNSGVLHVVAASGSNVALVSSFALSLFLLCMKRKGAIMALFGTLATYALIAGLDPSIVRATIMGSIAFSAQLFGRQNYSYLALAITAWVMLMIDPELLTHVGFQLSFLATLGILSIKPLLDKRIKNLQGGALKDDFSTTCAAQILTIPIISYHFQTFAPISFISNLLILWTIPILMLLGGLAAIVSLIHPILSIPFLYLCYPLLWYFEHVVYLTAINPIEINSFSLALIVGYYCLVTAFILKKR
jgi:competence protein ComEC